MLHVVPTSSLDSNRTVLTVCATNDIARSQVDLTMTFEINAMRFESVVITHSS